MLPRRARAAEEGVENGDGAIPEGWLYLRILKIENTEGNTNGAVCVIVHAIVVFPEVAEVTSSTNLRLLVNHHLQEKKG